MGELDRARVALLVLLDHRVFGTGGLARARFSEPDFYRASGLCTCKVCGRLYYDHKSCPTDPWLTVLCNGQRVKL